ncbi:MAG: flagellar hook capping FlgD N-terminal domain-containing protein, partial [Pseudomonadota bacterium]
MAIDSATTAAAATTSTTAATSRNSTTIAGTFDTFMKLLTTQLQHQDPTSPTDSNQFTQQLVAFAGVQQQTQTNDNLTKILASLQTNQVGAASSFIG